MPFAFALVNDNGFHIFTPTMFASLVLVLGHPSGSSFFHCLRHDMCVGAPGSVFLQGFTFDFLRLR